MRAAGAAPLLHMQAQQLRKGGMKARDFLLQRELFFFFFSDFSIHLVGKRASALYLFSCWEQKRVLMLRAETCSHVENRFLFSAGKQKFLFTENFVFLFILNWIQNPRMSKKQHAQIQHEPDFCSREQSFCFPFFILSDLRSYPKS